MDGFAARGGWWVVGQAGVFAVVAAALWWGGSSGPGPLAIALGALLVAAGGALAADGLFRIRAHLTAMPAPVQGAPLVERGSYRLVRHPIYGGLVIAAGGLAAARSSWAGAAAAAALLAFFALKARHEERMLASAYDGYSAYTERVRRRLIPYVF